MASRTSADSTGSLGDVRRGFGRPLILGLEVLVAADIIKTITVDPTTDTDYSADETVTLEIKESPTPPAYVKVDPGSATGTILHEDNEYSTIIDDDEDVVT